MRLPQLALVRQQLLLQLMAGEILFLIRTQLLILWPSIFLSLVEQALMLQMRRKLLQVMIQQMEVLLPGRLEQHPLVGASLQVVLWEQALLE